MNESDFDNTMNTKRTILIKLAVIMILSALCTGMIGCDAHEHEIKTLTYTEDYPQMYANELKQIFGDYTLGDLEEIHIEGEECGCGYHRDELNYYEWKITYTDSCGQNIECRLNNRESIYSQQYEWLEDQIETHIYSDYMKEFYGELMTDQKTSYCYCILGDFCNETTTDVMHLRYELGKAYRHSLEERDELIPLNELSYKEIFNRYPIVISVSVRLNDRTLEENEWSENYSNAVRILDEMSAKIAGDIGNNLNMDAHLYSDVQTLDPGTGETWIYYLRGEKTGPVNLDQEVFESYNGVYWDFSQEPLKMDLL